MDKMYWKIFLLPLISLYSFGMGVYAGYVASHNEPNNDSSDIFIASYAICIVQSILYISEAILIIFRELFSKNDEGDITGKELIPIIINIYWVFISLNFKVSDAYDTYAFIKMCELFTMLGLFFVTFCCTCLFVFMCTGKSRVHEHSMRIDDL